MFKKFKERISLPFNARIMNLFKVFWGVKMIFSNLSGRSNNNLSNTSLIEELTLSKRVNSLFPIKSTSKERNFILTFIIGNDILQYLNSKVF